jgi:hypothetical protein
MVFDQSQFVVSLHQWENSLFVGFYNEYRGQFFTHIPLPALRLLTADEKNQWFLGALRDKHEVEVSLGSEGRRACGAGGCAADA